MQFDLSTLNVTADWQICVTILRQLAMQVGIVQTAYANGASTDFMRNSLGIETIVAPTGVKHLHEEAVKFDIGIYFEANGHGTVLFSPALLQRLSQVIILKVAGNTGFLLCSRLVLFLCARYCELKRNLFRTVW